MTEGDIRLRLNVSAEEIETPTKIDEFDREPRVAVPAAVAVSVAVMMLQGVALAGAAYIVLAVGVLAERVVDPFAPYPWRATSQAFQSSADGGEALATFLVLGAGLLAVAFLATATMLIRLEWRGIALVLQAMILVVGILMILSEDALPNLAIIAVPAVSGLVVLLLSTPRATTAFVEHKARRKHRGELDIAKLVAARS